jgi:hypothetical protein
MRRFAILIILIGEIFLSISPMVSAATSHRKTITRCLAGRSHVIVANAKAQVYEGPSIGKRGESIPESPVYYGCVYGRKKSYELGLPEGGTSGGSWRSYAYTLAGPIVAYAEAARIGYEEQNPKYIYKVVVRDLLNGRLLHNLPTGIPPRGANREGIGEVTALVVKRDGAVAWIVQVLENMAGGRLRSNYEVRAVDKAGRRVLAISTEIGPHSLKLRGSTLHWTQGGKPMSATLN